ncbi:hypothetical protein [Marinobacterium litorale]|uniref:hypothetical protein n=1 Tax=Marinobacterium litorale TaxID=404770 RepID=UPI000485372F|nr:hypothetical protein [Marinobacterium litorale]
MPNLSTRINRAWKGVSLFSVAVVLAACSAPKYWYEPVVSVGTLSGEWNGMVRSQALTRYTWTRMGGPVWVECNAYADRIRFQVRDQVLEAELGREKPLRVEAAIDGAGRFQAQVAFEGETWVYGGVMMLETQPRMTISGVLHADTGLGEGGVFFAPGNSRVGCEGHFRVSLNSAPVSEEHLGEPLVPGYWIDEADMRWGSLGLVRPVGPVPFRHGTGLFY